MTGLSVVIPARDAAATLVRTLDGLTAHPEVTEIVVVDDGSTDDTAALAVDAGARLVRGPGTGPAAARNRGAAAATEPLVAFCDADDEWIAPSPDPRLALLVADPEADGAWGQVVCRPAGADHDEPPTHLGALHGLVLRRRALAVAGPFAEDMRLGEDVDWILRARRAGLRLVKLDVPCARYHLRPGSLSHGEGRRAAGLLAAARRSVARSAAASVLVAVPAADGARYLGEALRSVLDQVPAPTRVVVADDASTDGTPQVAREAGAEVVRLRRRSGPNAARAAAMAAGGSELVAFCDADDLWPPGRLGVMLTALATEPTAAGVIGRVEAFASPDRDVTGLAVPEGPVPGVVIGALLVRRADLDAVGGLRTDLIGGELVALERALAGRGRALVRIDEVVLRRRIHGDNLTLTRAEEVRRAYLTLAVERIRGRS